MIRTSILISFIWALLISDMYAQIIHSPVNTALGGGGTAYTTGYESLFINPANLLILERDYRLQISSGAAGAYLSPPARSPGYRAYKGEYLLHVTGRRGGGIPGSFNNYQDLTDRNYAGDRLISEHLTSGEFHWLGVHWANPGMERSYAFAVRSRFGNRYQVGRNFYDPFPVQSAHGLEFDRSLHQQYQYLHEVSFGYAEQFDFISGHLPQLSRLVVGIAPKFVMSGAFLDVSYRDQYSGDPDETGFQQETEFHHLSAGVYSEMTRNFLSNPDQFNPSHNRSNLMSPTGYGAGMDIGLTYMITLGDDLSVVPQIEGQARKSLRISLSITDIGFLIYTSDTEKYTKNESATEVSSLPEPVSQLFLGRPGEQFRFLNRDGQHPLKESSWEFSNRFTMLLPTALHGGALFQLNWFKVMGDFSVGLTNNAFTTTRFKTYLGTEIRPLPFLPLRAGTRIAVNLPDYYSFGAGLETRYADLNAAIQLRSRAVGPTGEIAGFAVGAIKIYLP